LSLGPWRWPSRSFPLNRIQRASVTRVDPTKLGGWGYRVCGRSCRAYVIRGGEALELAFRDGRRRILTVDGAEQGAGLINDLIARDEP
jgi:hypothetical protein